MSETDMTSLSASVAKALATSGAGSPPRPAVWRTQQELSARMTPSEAITAATAIIECYPNGGAGAGKGYVGAIASMLASFPRSVGQRCADRLHGITRTCKFLPTPADVAAWCEREGVVLHERARGEASIAAQFAAREEPVPDPTVRDGLRELADSLRPPERDPESDKARNQAAYSKRCAEVVAEWGNERAPTCGGVPISRELTEILKRPPGSSMRNFV